jgi:hypothetical protein
VKRKRLTTQLICCLGGKGRDRVRAPVFPARAGAPPRPDQAEGVRGQHPPHPLHAQHQVGQGDSRPRGKIIYTFSYCIPYGFFVSITLSGFQ